MKNGAAQQPHHDMQVLPLKQWEYPQGDSAASSEAGDYTEVTDFYLAPAITQQVE